MRTQLAVLASLAVSMSFGQLLRAEGPVNSYSISLTGTVEAASGPATLYEDLTTSTGFYYDGDYFSQLVADDLHMTAAGSVNGFKFGYYDPAGVSEAKVAFYANDATDTTVTGPIASFTVPNLPGVGTWIISVDVPAFVAPKDIWMSVSFGKGSLAGLLVYDPPTVGTSHDLFLDLNTNQQIWLGGNPKSNFAVGVYAVPEPGALAALAVGLAGLVGLRKRR